MWIRQVSQTEEFTAGDGSLLRELLHPDKSELDVRFSLAHAVVLSGQTTLPHRLENAEIYYILEGSGKMTVDGEIRDVEPGTVIYIPRHAVQFISNSGSGDLRFLCLVDPAWRRTDETILPKT